MQGLLFDAAPIADQVNTVSGVHRCSSCGKVWRCEFKGPRPACPRIADPRCVKCSRDTI
jgi:hypothetical protein